MNRVYKFFKWLLILASSACFLWLAVSCAMYRIPAGSTEQIFSGEVHYKFIELDLTNRGVFENLLGNQIVRLDGHRLFYVPIVQKNGLWPEPQGAIWDRKYTFRVKLKAKPLLFGGYEAAKVAGISRVEKEPVRSK